MSAKCIKKPAPKQTKVYASLEIPSKNDPVREALAIVAADGDTFAQELLETIRRAETGEPIGSHYALQLEEFMNSRMVH